MAPIPAQTLHAIRPQGQGGVMAGEALKGNKLPLFLGLMGATHRRNFRALGKQGNSIYLKPFFFSAK